MNIENMKSAWLIAVENGKSEDFSRHFVPDILSAFANEKERARIALMEMYRAKKRIQSYWKKRTHTAEERAQKAEQDRDRWHAQQIIFSETLFKTEAQVASLTEKIAPLERVVQAALRARAHQIFNAELIRQSGEKELDEALAALSKISPSVTGECECPQDPPGSAHHTECPQYVGAEEWKPCQWACAKGGLCTDSHTNGGNCEKCGYGKKFLKNKSTP